MVSLGRAVFWWETARFVSRGSGQPPFGQPIVHLIHYHREDLMQWYAECGYEEIVVTPYWKAFWNGYGKRGVTY